MFEDLPIVLTWCAIVMSLSTSTHHLLRWSGIIVSSQGAMVLVGAFTFASLARLDVAPPVATCGAVIVCSCLGITHRYLLYTSGPYLFVLLCIAFDVLLSELWLAVPHLTGGSGGLLLPRQSVGCALVASFMGVAVAVIARLLSGDPARFDWATIRAYGWHSGLFGVNDWRRLGLMFAAYGVVAGCCGSAVVACVGYVAPSGFHLPFTMVIVMIAVAGNGRSLVRLTVLSGTFACIRTVLRQSLVASSAVALSFEILFPIVLTAVIILRLAKRRSSGDGAQLGALV